MENTDGMQVMRSYKKFLNTHGETLSEYNTLKKTLEALALRAHSLEESSEGENVDDEKKKISANIGTISLKMFGLKNQLIEEGQKYGVTAEDVQVLFDENVI